MRVGMLGPLEVRTGDGGTVEVAGARLRALVILLALEPGRVIPPARLVDGVWGGRPPAGAANALQALVSRLRRTLPEGTIESHPAGYRLAIDPDAVDAVRFERLAAAGRAALAGDPARALRDLSAALDLWRGPALPEVAGSDFFQPAIVRLTELRLAAAEDRAEAALRLGRGAELTAELASLVAEHPLRERLVGALMRALCAAGRPAEALTVFERAREALAESLGTDPSPELSDLHTSVLRGEVREVTAGSRPGPGPDDTVDQRPRTNLRAGLTSFVGRDDEVARVRELVGEYRLTTLTGPGGSGKTRLSVEAARGLLDQARDGVWLVELAPLATGADVPQAVLTALGLRELALGGLAHPGGPLDRLAAALRDRSTLLVLDNCEHVLDATARLADRLLGECPRLRILATSREPLGITGEVVWPVEGLALPPPGADVATAMSCPATRLLADRAAAARPGFAVTERTVADIVAICRALDGIPLAIELAAARLRAMTPERLAARLDDRFRLLVGGDRTALPRHQTLRAMVDWGWELLSEEERTLLRRLAVFAGSVSVEAAERVCARPPLPADRVLDLLGSLTDKSLLVAGVDGRYRMLETIRAYGLERLDLAGERDHLRRAHAAYFAELAETADPHLRRAEQLVWLARLAAEHDDITAAVRAAVAAGDAPSAVRVVAAAGWYWWLSGHKAEGAELAAAALAVPGRVADRTLALAYGVSVLFATTGLGDERVLAEPLREARRLAERAGWSDPLLRFLEPLAQWVRSAEEGTTPSLDVLDPLLADEDPWIRAQARLNRARVRLNAGGGQAAAEADIRAGLAEFRAIGERWGISFSLTVLAELTAQRGDLAAAHDYYGQAIAFVTEVGTVEDVLMTRTWQARVRWLLGDREGGAAVLAEVERDAERVGWPDAVVMIAMTRAEVARWSGDPGSARAHLARAQAAARRIVVHPVFTAMVRSSLGLLAALEGDVDTARARHAEALDLALGSAHAPTVAQVLVGVADVAMRLRRPRAAARLLAASEAVRGGPDLANPDAARVAAAARAELGERAFAEAARGGRDGLVAVRELAAAVLDSGGRYSGGRSSGRR